MRVIETRGRQEVRKPGGEEVILLPLDNRSSLRLSENPAHDTKNAACEARKCFWEYIVFQSC